MTRDHGYEIQTGKDTEVGFTISNCTSKAAESGILILEAKATISTGAEASGALPNSSSMQRLTATVSKANVAAAVAGMHPSAEAGTLTTTAVGFHLVCVCVLCLSA